MWSLTVSWGHTLMCVHTGQLRKQHTAWTWTWQLTDIGTLVHTLCSVCSTSLNSNDFRVMISFSDLSLIHRCMHWPTCPMNTTLMCSFLGASGCVGGTLGAGASSSSSIISGAVSSVVACSTGPRSPPPGSSSFGSASFWSHGSSVLISVSPFSTGAANKVHIIQSLFLLTSHLNSSAGWNVDGAHYLTCQQSRTHRWTSITSSSFEVNIFSTVLSLEAFSELALSLKTLFTVNCCDQCFVEKWKTRSKGKSQTLCTK